MSRDRAQSLRLFQTHNGVQLSRLTALAPHPQPLFFQLLPLILHGNFKLLPGFVSEDCSTGIIDYQPDIASLRAASSVDRNFQFRRKALRRYALRGVYLLNSFSGFSYPQNPHFTLWVIHNAHLPTEACQTLQAKLQAITVWASQLGIKLDSLLVSEADVRQHPDIQYNLANFYTNGLVLAGSLPLWWLIGSDEHADYNKIADRLLAQHQLSHNSLLDFGAVPPAEPQRLLANVMQCWMAAFWGDARQDLALLFAAQQCQSLPETVDLSLLFKQAIETDDNDSAMLSKAHLQLTALANDLRAEDLQRARQSLYLQSQERLSHKVLHPAHPWRRQFISVLVANWQWPAMQLRGLDQPLTLGLRELLKQPAKRWQWLDDILNVTQQFVWQQSLSDNDIKLARKRLTLKQQPQADVITQLGLSAISSNGPEQLNLNRQSDKSPWQLSDLPAGTRPQQALYSHKALVNVLAFAIINGLLSRSSWLRVNDPQPQLASHHILELSQLLLRSALATPVKPADSAALNQPANAIKIILLANLQPAPLDYLQQQGLQLSSNQNDPLSFSSAQANLIASVDILLLSSWGQWHHRQFTGPTAVIEMLASVL
ncbi:MAG: class I adenylate cyclase, partial [Methylophaga sp.]|nr:class I adenylate cyclase [Methylophaga sp.]